MSGRRIGILGGTFDPIHLGHLAVARAARGALALDTVLLMPAHVPPHRPSQPHASAFHRFAMAALAAQADEALQVSDLELRADGPSYTSATLARLHASGYAPSQLFFLTGADAFADIATWHDFPQFLDAASFVVISRPGRPVAELPARLPSLASRMQHATGRDEAGTWSRAVASETTSGHLPVWLIDVDTPDISATAIRARCAEGAPLTGFVEPAVERHLARHGLYRAAPHPRPTAGGRPPFVSLHEQEHV